MTASWADLIAAIVADTPRLPGALCRRQSGLFEDPDRTEEAIIICQTQCPALAQCAEWAATLKHNQRHGVLAGQYVEWISHPSVARKGNERKSQ